MISQTAILLRSLNYGEAVIGGAHIISQHVEAPYWAAKLSSQFSVRPEDLTDIVDAMLKDSDQNRL